MKVTKIFLDLDDVLCDFTLPALYQAGCNINPNDFSVYSPEWGYDIVKAYNQLKMSHLENCNSFEFWRKFSSPFWSGLKKTAFADDLVSACACAVKHTQIFILTAPTDSHECYSGKKLWIDNNFPIFAETGRIILANQKHLLADSGSLLIDDSDANVDAFRKHGGCALLLPRPWNTKHECSTQLAAYSIIDVLSSIV